MTTHRYFMTGLFVVPLVCFLSMGDSVARSYVNLTAADVKQVVEQEYSKVKRCYSRHAMRQKQADGKVELHLQINASGKVAKVEVDAPSVRGKKFERCVSSVARKWRFPSASGGTDVTYPYLFVHGHRHARRHRHRHRRRHR